MAILVGVNEKGHKVGQYHQRAKYSDRVIEQTRTLRDDGMTYMQISIKMEIPYWTVIRICRHERRAERAVKWKKIDP
jgi:hypothetical protein